MAERSVKRPKRVSAKSARGAVSPRRARPITPKRLGHPPTSKGATGAGGPIAISGPTAAQLQVLLPTANGTATFRTRRQSVVTQSGVVARGTLARNAVDLLPGFRWDVPAPEPGRRLLWANISFGWQFWQWRSLGVVNNGGSNVHVDGSVDWRWVLTGNPHFIGEAPILMEDSGHFTFETFIVPGAAGYDVGWLVPPRGETYSSATTPGVPSPLARLLSTKKDGALRLWFGVDLQNATLEYSGPISGGGWAMGGGPDTLFYTYAYTGPALPIADWDDIVLSQD